MARNKYDVDEIYEEHFDLGQLKRLGRYVLPYKKDMIIAAVLMLSSSAATMLIPRFFMTVMNDMIPNRDVQGLVRISLLTLLSHPVLCLRPEDQDQDHQPGGADRHP